MGTWLPWWMPNAGTWPHSTIDSVSCRDTSDPRRRSRPTKRTLRRNLARGGRERQQILTPQCLKAEEDNDDQHEMSNIRDSFVAVAFVAAAIQAMPLPMR